MYEDEEINLSELFNVLWQWKRLIVGGTLLCVIAAVIVSLILPKIYEVSMIVEPGILGKDDRNYFIFIDTPENMAGKITGGAYDLRIMKEIGFDPAKKEIKFTATADKRSKSNAVSISSEWAEEDIEPGVAASRKLIDFLQQEYGAIISNRKKDFDHLITLKEEGLLKIEVQRKDLEKQIANEQNALQKIREDIKLEQTQGLNVKKQIDEYLEESKSVKENTGQLLQHRESVLKNPGATDNNLSLLLYTTTIQQNVAYFNKIQDQMYDLKREAKNVEGRIFALTKAIKDTETAIERLKLQQDEGLQTQIEDIKTGIERLKLSRDMITDIKIVQDPEVSSKPIKPKKKLIVLLAGMASLLVFTLVAFIMNTVRKTTEVSP